jgi:hypothetical protein
VKQVFQTQDGKLFEDREEAVKHETAIYEAWIATDPDINVTAFLEIMDDENAAYENCTELSVAHSLLRGYFEKLRPNYVMNQPDHNPGHFHD